MIMKMGKRIRKKGKCSDKLQEKERHESLQSLIGFTDVQ
jgi:hypothetical protein